MFRVSQAVGLLAGVLDEGSLGGPRHTFHGLPHMQRHIRPERLSELIDDLTVICEDLIAAREPAPGNGLDGLPRRTR